MKVEDKVTLQISRMSPLNQTILTNYGIDESTVFTILSMGWDLAFIQSDTGHTRICHQNYLSPVIVEEILT